MRRKLIKYAFQTEAYTLLAFLYFFHVLEITGIFLQFIIEMIFRKPGEMFGNYYDKRFEQLFREAEEL